MEVVCTSRTGAVSTDALSRQRPGCAAPWTPGRSGRWFAEVVDLAHWRGVEDVDLEARPGACSEPARRCCSMAAARSATDGAPGPGLSDGRRTGDPRDIAVCFSARRF